jgi:hypothetical protein
MFGSKARRIKQLEEALAALVAESEKTLDRPKLFDIEKDGRRLSFLFYKRGEIYRVDTLAPLGFDVARTKKELL